MMLTERESRERVARAAVERWNDDHPIGTPVRYWPGFREGDGRRGATRSTAFIAGKRDPEPVVFVEGYAGWIALSHVEVSEQVEARR